MRDGDPSPDLGDGDSSFVGDFLLMLLVLLSSTVVTVLREVVVSSKTVLTTPCELSAVTSLGLSCFDGCVFGSFGGLSLPIPSSSSLLLDRCFSMISRWLSSEFFFAGVGGSVERIVGLWAGSLAVLGRVGIEPAGKVEPLGSVGNDPAGKAEPTGRVEPIIGIGLCVRLTFWLSLSRSLEVKLAGTLNITSFRDTLRLGVWLRCSLTTWE